MLKIQLDVGHYTLDRAPTVDAAACGVGVDERPLRGPAGLVDWRLGGLLSRQLLSERYEGRLGEDMLVASLQRLPFSRIFLLGLGRAADMDEDMARQVVSRTAGVLIKAGVPSVVLGLWDLTRDRVPFEEGLDSFLKGCSRATAQGTELDQIDVYLLARSPTESGRVAHHLDQRLEDAAPAGLELGRI